MVSKKFPLNRKKKGGVIYILKKVNRNHYKVNNFKQIHSDLCRFYLEKQIEGTVNIP